MCDLMKCWCRHFSTYLHESLEFSVSHTVIFKYSPVKYPVFVICRVLVKRPESLKVNRNEICC